MRKYITAIITALLLLFLVFGGRLIVYSDLNGHDITSDIVILMGSLSDRTLGAYDLTSQQAIGQIYIVKTFMEGSDLLKARGAVIPNYADLSKWALVELGLALNDIVVVEASAKSTIDEAVALKDFLKTHRHHQQIIIVTSKYHTLRAKLIFSHIFREIPIDIRVFATPYDSFDPHLWFTRREDTQDVLGEYVKLVHFLLIEQWVRR